MTGISRRKDSPSCSDRPHHRHLRVAARCSPYPIRGYSKNPDHTLSAGSSAQSSRRPQCLQRNAWIGYRRSPVQVPVQNDGWGVPATHSLGFIRVGPRPKSAMNPGSSGPWHREQGRAAAPGIGSARSSSTNVIVCDSSSPGAVSWALSNDGSSTPSMLVPQDQQTRKPASTVSPHLEQVQDPVADVSEGGDKGKGDLDACAVSGADSVTTSAGAPARSGSGTGIETV